MNPPQVKDWLKAIKKDRQWLARQTGSQIKTVNNWLSSNRGIPAQATRLITRLMEQFPTDISTPDAPENYIILSVNEATFDAWNSAAMAENKLLRQWCIDVITEHVNNLPNK